MPEYDDDPILDLIAPDAIAGDDDDQYPAEYADADPAYAPYQPAAAEYKPRYAEYQPARYGPAAVQAYQPQGPANPPPAAPNPPGLLKHGQASFSNLPVKDRARILNTGFGPGVVPNPRTASLKGLADPNHANEWEHGVKYLRDIRKLRSKYEVTLGSTVKRRLEIFDTAKIKAVYLHKLGKTTNSHLLTDAQKAEPIAPKPRAQMGAAMLGRDQEENKQWKGLVREWYLDSLIWVCSNEPGRTQPIFYSHIGKIGKFHHSSFKAGGGVIGAGEWIVANGKLLKVSANSGHYRPTIEQLHRSVLYMASAWNQDTVVLLWNVPKNIWEEVPVLMFRANPTQGGTYKSHPSA